MAMVSKVILKMETQNLIGLNIKINKEIKEMIKDKNKIMSHLLYKNEKSKIKKLLLQ